MHSIIPIRLTEQPWHGLVDPRHTSEEEEEFLKDRDLDLAEQEWLSTADYMKSIGA